MRNLADFKRATTLGSRWKRTWRDQAPIVGVVTKRQTNAIAFTYSEGEGEPVESWLYWPKAKEVSFPNDRVMQIKDSYGVLLSYERL